MTAVLTAPNIEEQVINDMMDLTQEALDLRVKMKNSVLSLLMLTDFDENATAKREQYTKDLSKCISQMENTLRRISHRKFYESIEATKEAIEV